MRNYSEEIINISKNELMFFIVICATKGATWGIKMDKDSYYYQLGEESVENGSIDIAVKYYLISIRLEKHFKTYERLYECYYKLHQLDLAYYFLELAYEENRNNDKVAFMYSLCMIDENREDRAKQILLSIIKRNPDYKKAKIEYEKITHSSYEE